RRQRKGKNAPAQSRIQRRSAFPLLLSRDLLSRLRQQFSLGPRQAFHSFTRNLIEQRIDFLRDEFFRRHCVVTFGFGSALRERALQNRRPAEPEQMSVKPSGDATAQERTV